MEPDTNNLALKKTILLFIIIIGVITLSFAFAIMHHEDNISGVNFSLIDQHNQPTTHKDLAGKHLLVFFGFTTCPDVCPTQLSKITQVMQALEEKGDSTRVRPVFITVDPERDTPEKIALYLSHFYDGFVGLTGSRVSLQQATDAFNTFLQKAPEPEDKDYNVSHSSLIYIVDPFSRIVDHIPFHSNIDDIIKQVKETI